MSRTPWLTTLASIAALAVYVTLWRASPASGITATVLLFFPACLPVGGLVRIIADRVVDPVTDWALAPHRWWRDPKSRMSFLIIGGLIAVFGAGSFLLASAHPVVARFVSAANVIAAVLAILILLATAELISLEPRKPGGRPPLFVDGQHWVVQGLTGWFTAGVAAVIAAVGVGASLTDPCMTTPVDGHCTIEAVGPAVRFGYPAMGFVLTIVIILALLPVGARLNKRGSARSDA